MSATVDPWGDSDAEEPAAPSASVATVDKPNPVKNAKSDEKTYACPHCGTELKPHHDSVGSLHCYSEACVGCCFLPPDETSAGKVRAKLEARPCPTAQKVSGF